MSARHKMPGAHPLDSSGLHLVCDRASVRRLAELSSGHPLACALQAAADDRLALAFVIDRRTPFPGGLIKSAERRGKPVLIFIGDDPRGTQSLGPAAWLCTRRARAWARFVIVHGAGGERDHYARAVETAERYGRAVLVECSSATAPDWALAFDCPMQIILPRDGVHPVSPVLH